MILLRLGVVMNHLGQEVIGLAFLLSYLPVLFYAPFLWWLDRYEKEPKHFLLVALLWGSIPAAFLSILIPLAFEPFWERKGFCAISCLAGCWFP